MSGCQTLARGTGERGGILGQRAADVGHLGLYGLEIALHGSLGGGAEILTTLGASSAGHQAPRQKRKTRRGEPGGLIGRHEGNLTFRERRTGRFDSQVSGWTGIVSV